jgi:HIRAN domain
VSDEPVPPGFSDDDDFETEVVGESFRQHELRALDARIGSDSRGRRTFMARLRPEPHNPHDPNAVVVIAADNNDHLGHLPRELAVTYQLPLLTRGGAEAPAILYGGIGKKASLGVWLDLTALNQALGIVPPSASVWSNAAPTKLNVAGNSPHAEMRVSTELDPHGQPLSLRFNRARRTERDLCELLGLARGLLADGSITEGEAALLRDWVGRHPDAVEHWAVRTIHDRLTQHFKDGVIDEVERADLKRLLDQLVSGELSAVCDTDAATTLPLDQPPPTIEWDEMTYVFTGQFAFGPRRDCEREVEKRGGTCEGSITKRTSFLVIGTFGSRDWVHTGFGRKIEKAVSYREAGVPLRIVAEDHWVSTL